MSTTPLNSKSMFSDYFKENGYDELGSSIGNIKAVWKPLIKNLQNLGLDGLAEKQNHLSWQLSENGITYNVYGDPKGMNRPWNLDVTPQLIHESEWKLLEKGLKQRSELLNLIFKDIYGKRNLLKSGIVPPEVIYSHGGFLRVCDQVSYSCEKPLYVHGCDMARGPDGNMWVIKDRTQAPSGMGYALENRLSLDRVVPELSLNMYVRQIANFYDNFKNLLLESHSQNNENPNIVVMTPGPHNETYFEHSYLAEYFGFSLVQGRDLIVRDGYLWMKNLNGLKKVDVVLRRVDDIYADPLELKEDSQLGVAGLLDVIRKNNVTIVNPIGSRILENSGLNPFMPALCKYFLDEELIIPQIATWWCGQELEKNYVMENLSQLIVKRIDHGSGHPIYYGFDLTKSELIQLRNQILAKPYLFVAQEKVSFSTSPTFTGNGFEPRYSSWRTFSIGTKDGYKVMPGGLVRVSPQHGNILVSNQKGGTSKDIWIIADSPEPKSKIFKKPISSSMALPGLNELPSLTAENLFWAGRYIGRTLSLARFTRMVVKKLLYNPYEGGNKFKPQINHLFQTLTDLTWSHPGFYKPENLNTKAAAYEELNSILFDVNRNGSLSQTISMFTNTYYSIRYLWSSDMWRLFDRIEIIWSDIQNNAFRDLQDMSQALDQLITRIIAFMGLVEKSILINQGLLLYFIGMQLEQAMQNVTKSYCILTPSFEDAVEYELLESLLISHESLNIYRYSYRTYINPLNVIDLILLHKDYPNSLMFQLSRMQKDLKKMPKEGGESNLMPHEHGIFEAYSLLRLANPQNLAEQTLLNGNRAMLGDLLLKIKQNLMDTNLEFSNRYFSHSYSQNQLLQRNPSQSLDLLS